jgi:hypothetical protein
MIPGDVKNQTYMDRPIRYSSLMRECGEHLKIHFEETGYDDVDGFNWHRTGTTDRLL